MKIKSIQDIDVKGKLVFLRGDYNVPLTDRQEIIDDTGLKESLPTLRFLVENGARVVCASHLGRPQGKSKRKYTLKPVAKLLSSLLDRRIKFIEETVGDKVESAKSQLKEGEVLLLQNLRFNPGEMKNEETFARQLAAGIDIYVNDAFGASHRSQASITGISRYVPVKAAGLLLKKEMDFLNMAIENPPKNYTVILGGAGVSDKIPLITNLVDKAQKIIIGGAMAYSFLKARGVNIGSSEVEEDCLQTCRDIMQKAEEKEVKLLLPVDHIAALTIEPEVTIRMIKKGEDIPEEMMGLDIGFETIQWYARELKDAELIVWNGPLGVYEIGTFSAGTTEIAREVAAGSATSIIAGGDSVAAINKTGVADKISHLSMGGVASLKYLAGEKLIGINALEEEK